MSTTMKFADIPAFTQDGHYRVDVPLAHLEDHVARMEEDLDLELNPDFQRGHVWDEPRQIAYVEYVLRGGLGSSEFRLNHPGWMKSWKGSFVLVDGLQRITALRRFLAGEIPAFGGYIGEYEDPEQLNMFTVAFRVNDLRTRADVLRWYLEINTGGVVHTAEEIERVEEMLAAEERSAQALAA